MKNKHLWIVLSWVFLAALTALAIGVLVHYLQNADLIVFAMLLSMELPYVVGKTLLGLILIAILVSAALLINGGRPSRL